MLEVLVDFLDNHPDVGMVYADTQILNQSTGEISSIYNTLEPFDKESLLEGNGIGPCFMYRRECRDVVGDYNEDLIWAEDYDMWLRISERFTIEQIPKILYTYRDHEETVGKRHSKTVIINTRRAILEAMIRRAKE